MSGTNFPNGLDDNTSLPNPGASDITNNASANLQHHYQHDTVNAAIKAIEAKLGTGASTPPGANQLLITTSNGTSTWGNLSVGGDLTGALPNPTLAASGVTAGTYGSNTQVPVITVDGKGRITSASSVAVTGGGGGGSTSPLTTKGDIWVFSTTDTRLPVGLDGYMLAADSTQTTGLKWVPAPTSAVWGSITGTLSSQTDLQTALNAKADDSGVVHIAGTETITGAKTFSASSTTVGTLLKINAASGNPEFDFQVAGVNMAKTYWDATNLRLTFQNNNNNNADALYFADPATFTDNISMKGATSGTVILHAPATASGTLTLPAATDTLMGKATTDTMTNKTYDTAGTGNVLKINGTQVSAVTGTGNTVVLAAGPTITGHPTIEGVTSTGATGTGKFVFDTSPVLTTATVAADPVANLGVASKQYVDNLGTTSLVQNETPGGLVNGSNTAYTTASTFATGSLRVYLNGQRLTAGSGNDYVEGTQAFTMQYAPATGDVLLVDYNITNTKFVQGSNSIVVQEAPSGSVNGSNTAFTTLLGKYVANTLEVFINGIQQTRTTDYTETSPGSGTFTMTTAPLTNDVVRVAYQFSTGASGNADTVDGYNANATPTANTIPVLDGSGYVPQAAINVAGFSNASSVWIPTLTGFSSNPSGQYRYIQVGKQVTLYMIQSSAGTSNSSAFTISLPIAAATQTGMVWGGICQVMDNGAVPVNPGIVYIQSGGTTLTVYKDWTGAVFTASGSKRMQFGTITYEAA